MGDRDTPDLVWVTGGSGFAGGHRPTSEEVDEALFELLENDK